MKCNVVLGDMTLTVDDQRVRDKHVITVTETQVGGAKKTEEKEVDSEMVAARIVASFLVSEDDKQLDGDEFSEAFPSFSA